MDVQDSPQSRLDAAEAAEAALDRRWTGAARSSATAWAVRTRHPSGDHAAGFFGAAHGDRRGGIGPERNAGCVVNRRTAHLQRTLARTRDPWEAIEAVRALLAEETARDWTGSLEA